MYSEKAIELLLPELESGLFDDNWRIRLSSVQLLGDLLYRISGQHCYYYYCYNYNRYDMIRYDTIFALEN